MILVNGFTGLPVDLWWFLGMTDIPIGSISKDSTASMQVSSMCGKCKWTFYSAVSSTCSKCKWTLYGIKYFLQNRWKLLPLPASHSTPWDSFSEERIYYVDKSHRRSQHWAVKHVFGLLLCVHGARGYLLLSYLRGSPGPKRDVNLGWVSWILQLYHVYPT